MGWDCLGFWGWIDPHNLPDSVYILSLCTVQICTSVPGTCHIFQYVSTRGTFYLEVPKEHVVMVSWLIPDATASILWFVCWGTWKCQRTGLGRLGLKLQRPLLRPAAMCWERGSLQPTVHALQPTNYRFRPL